MVRQKNVKTASMKLSSLYQMFAINSLKYPFFTWRGRDLEESKSEELSLQKHNKNQSVLVFLVDRPIPFTARRQ